MLNEKNQEKLDRAKAFLTQNNVFYSELPNGQLKIDTANFWATSEKFYDTATGAKGQGLNAFVMYLRQQGRIA